MEHQSNQSPAQHESYTECLTGANLLARETDYPRIIAAKAQADSVKPAKRSEMLDSIARDWGYKNWATCSALVRQPDHAYPANDDYERAIHTSLGLDTQDPAIISAMIKKFVGCDRSDPWNAGREKAIKQIEKMIDAMVTAQLSFCRKKNVLLTADVLRQSFSQIDTPLGLCHMIRLSAMGYLEAGARRHIFALADCFPEMEQFRKIPGAPLPEIANGRYDYFGLVITKSLRAVIDYKRYGRDRATRNT